MVCRREQLYKRNLTVYVRCRMSVHSEVARLPLWKPTQPQFELQSAYVIVTKEMLR